MARTRQAQKNSSRKRPRATRGDVSHEQKLRALTKAGKRPDPTNTRAVSRAHSELQRRKTLERNYGKPVTRKQAATLREKGFYVSRNKVIVDVPRNIHREKIPHTRFSVLRSGVVKFTNTERRDYVIGFTKAEKKEFAKDPAAFRKKKLAEFRRQNPTAAKYWKTAQVRLQWGAFQGTKEFAPSYFTATYFASISPEETRKQKRGKRRPRIDKLTGFHIVIHAAAPRKRAKKNNTRRRGRKGRNT